MSTNSRLSGASSMSLVTAPLLCAPTAFVCAGKGVAEGEGTPQSQL